MKMSRLGAFTGALVLVAGVAFAEEAAAPVVGSSILTLDINVVRAVATGYRASQLIGANIYNDENDKIGKVDDFIVGSDQQVSIAIVSVGGFLGMGKRLVAVPATMFEGDTDGRIVLPGGTKEALENLPAFQYAK